MHEFESGYSVFGNVEQEVVWKLLTHVSKLLINLRGVAMKYLIKYNKVHNKITLCNPDVTTVSLAYKTFNDM